jgi:ABC-type uncharacterized transport system permease subunit
LLSSLGFWNEWLTASIRLSAPLMLTSVGGVLNERSGVFNIGLEGMMLVGAFFAVAGTTWTGNVFMGASLAMIAGGILGLIHAYLTVSRKANQIVSGAAINMFALGFTNLMMRQLFMEDRLRISTYPILAPEALRNIPVLGPLIFAQPVIVWVACLLPIMVGWILFRTNWGLNVRAVGEYPKAVATAGLSVFRLRYICVILSGVFAGLGGSALALAELGYFTQNMTAGRGFVVLAALVFGKWNPVYVALACLLFGGADALQLRVQTLNPAIPYQFLVMLPYVLTIAALIGLVGRTNQPQSLGIAYEPEEN